MHQHLYSRHIGQTSLKISAFYNFFLFQCNAHGLIPLGQTSLKFSAFYNFFLFQCNAPGLIPLTGLSVNRFTRSKSPRGYIPHVDIIDSALP